MIIKQHPCLDKIDNMVYMPYNMKRETMNKFKVIFYENENGKCPVKEFIDTLTPKMRSKMIGMLEILQDNGYELREPYSKSLNDGIFEIRCKVGTDITRVLYFFYCGGNIVLTNGFIKKTPKTPPQEIILAKNRRSDYIRRHQK